MYVYYYTKDTNFDDMPDGVYFKKGTISYASEESNEVDGLRCAEVELTEEQIEQLAFLKYDETKGKAFVDEDEKAEFHKNVLRNRREILLLAFDKYKANVQYGIVEESDTQKEEVIKWYKSVLDLNEDAINNPPSFITYYIPQTAEKEKTWKY